MGEHRDDEDGLPDEDFKARVLREIGGDVESPLVGTDGEDLTTAEHQQPLQAALQVTRRGPISPEVLQPSGPGVDGLGYVLVPFTCFKCGVKDHMSPHIAEAYVRHRVPCLPCKSPHLYKWKRDSETGERFLLPLPAGRKPLSRLGEAERRELETRATELVDLKLRRDYLQAAILKMQAEVTDIEPRIEDLATNVLPHAQRALEEIETDPRLEQRQTAADLAHEIGLVAVSIAKQRSKEQLRAREDARKAKLHR